MIDAKLKAEGNGDEDHSTQPDRGIVVDLMAALKEPRKQRPQPDANAKPHKSPTKKAELPHGQAASPARKRA
jgi:non-homologous end joining protein Ku